MGLGWAMAAVESMIEATIRPSLFMVVTAYENDGLQDHPQNGTALGSWIVKSRSVSGGTKSSKP
jgi:hypothetical protein